MEVKLPNPNQLRATIQESRFGRAVAKGWERGKDQGRNPLTGEALEDSLSKNGADSTMKALATPDVAPVQVTPPNIQENPQQAPATQDQIAQRFAEAGGVDQALNITSGKNPVSFEGRNGVDASTLPPKEKTVDAGSAAVQPDATADTEGAVNNSDSGIKLDEYGEIVGSRVPGADAGPVAAGDSVDKSVADKKIEPGVPPAQETPRKEYWGGEYEINPDVLAIKKSIAPVQNEDGSWAPSERVQAKIDNLKQKGEAVPDIHTLQNEVVAEAWDGFVEKYPGSAESFMDKDPQIGAAIARKAQKEAAARRSVEAAGAEQKTPPVVQEPAAEAATVVNESTTPMAEEGGGFSPDVKVDNTAASADISSDSMAEEQGGHQSEVQKTPASEKSSAEKAAEAQLALREKGEKAYKELTEEQHLDITGDTSVDYLMGRLEERGWKPFPETRQHIWDAVNHARVLQAEEAVRQAGSAVPENRTNGTASHVDVVVSANAEPAVVPASVDGATSVPAAPGENGASNGAVHAEAVTAEAAHADGQSETSDTAEAQDPRDAKIAHLEEMVTKMTEENQQLREQIGEIIKAFDGFRKEMAEQMQAMGDTMDMEEGKERRKKMKSIFLAIGALLVKQVYHAGETTVKK